MYCLPSARICELMNHRKMSFHDRGGGHNGPTDVHSKQADSAPGPIRMPLTDEVGALATDTP